MNNGFFGFPLADLNKSAGDRANFPGRLLRISKFTSSGNWVKQKDVGFIMVHLLGAGGGGGGAQGGGNNGSAGGSGAGGGGCFKRIQAGFLQDNETVTIGNGGSGGTNLPSAGSNGGTTSFGIHCSATGGQGGQSVIGTTTIGGITGSGGFGVDGDINFYGQAGNPPMGDYGSCSKRFPGGMGALPLGSSGAQAVLGTDVNAYSGMTASSNTGGGGSGGVCLYNNPGSKVSGGNGGSGLAVIYEFS